MGRRKKGDKVNGWVNLDKPIGLTSTQAMAKVRKILNAQKAGHAGTLDPLASGILPVALGEATKTIPFAQDAHKVYEFTARWGEQRSTDDREGDVIAASDHRPTPADIEAILPHYIGEISQVPPKFSAIKVDGQRAYDLARGGEDVELKARNVFVEDLSLTASDADSATFTLVCGKGTYVRSLARDMAIELGTFGYVSALKRTVVGNFAIDTSISLEKLEEIVNSAASSEGSLDGALLPLEAVLDDIPALALKEDELSKLRNGGLLSFVAKPDFERIKALGLETDQTAIAMFQGQAVALVERQGPNIKPVRVFNV